MKVLIDECAPKAIKVALAASGFDEQAKVVGRYFWEIFIDPDERAAMRQRFYDAAPGHPRGEYENTFR